MTDSKRIRLSHMTTTAPHLQKIAVSLLAIGLVGCTSITGDKVDYRGASEKSAGLEVPPDLTQLARDTRYQQQAASGSFSAATYGAATQKTQGTQAVVPSGESDLRIERVGSDRWLVTKMSPEQVWPVLEAFWPERGFKLALDQPEVGVMETEWAENHSKMPQDFIRSTIGSLFDSIYDTGERDKFRTRVERTVAGSEIYITHRGMTEVTTGTQSDSTLWQPRPADPELEAEMLRRLLLKLGAKEEQAKTLVAASDAPRPPRARLAAAPAQATIELDDSFDRAWRRVGIALDRSNFTVEDRDRTQGVYFVRYIESKDDKNDPGFFSRIFGSSKQDPKNPSRYRVQVKPAGTGSGSVVTVVNAAGTVENKTTEARIAELLVEDLK